MGGVNPARAPSRFTIIDIKIIIPRPVAWQLGLFELLMIFLYDPVLDHFAAAGIDRVGNICVEFGTPIRIERHSFC